MVHSGQIQADVAAANPTGRPRGRAKKYVPNEQIDAAIREAYRKMRACRDRRAIKLAASRIGWPRFAVTRRARILGLARTKEKPWSEEEIAFLARWGWMCDERLSEKFREAGFSRSPAAVHLKRTRLWITRNGDWFSARQLAQAFGVDEHKVTRWIEHGQLEATRRQTQRLPQQGGDTWLILRKAVKKFLLACPEEYELGRVEKFWFLDLITDGRISR